jgi:hypothetical protein
MTIEFHLPELTQINAPEVCGYHHPKPNQCQDQQDYEVLKTNESSYHAFYPMLDDTRTLEQKYGQFVEKLMKKSNVDFISELTQFNDTDYEYACVMFKSMFFEQLFTRCLELAVFETDIEIFCIKSNNSYLEYLVENKKCPDEFIMKCIQFPLLHSKMIAMSSFYSHRYHCKSSCSYYTEKVKQKIMSFGYAIAGYFRQTKSESKSETKSK